MKNRILVACCVFCMCLYACVCLWLVHPKSHKLFFKTHFACVIFARHIFGNLFLPRLDFRYRCPGNAAVFRRFLVQIKLGGCRSLLLEVIFASGAYMNLPSPLSLKSGFSYAGTKMRSSNSLANCTKLAIQLPCIMCIAAKLFSSLCDILDDASEV